MRARGYFASKSPTASAVNRPKTVAADASALAPLRRPTVPLDINFLLALPDAAPKERTEAVVDGLIEVAEKWFVDIESRVFVRFLCVREGEWIGDFVIISIVFGGDTLELVVAEEDSSGV